jgi:hypothetical protein
MLAQVRFDANELAHALRARQDRRRKWLANAVEALVHADDHFPAAAQEEALKLSDRHDQELQ